MERGEIDFRLAWWAEPASTLRFKALFNDSFVCVARRGHPGVRSDRISEAAFVAAEHVVVQRSRSGLSYEALESAFARHNHTRKVALHVQDALSLCNAVRHSDLLAALPERFAMRLAPVFDLQVLAIPLAVGMARQSLYWHERTHKLPSHRWFRALLTNVASTVGTDPS
jgi:DNA-binding transcriptional LysR family regulator